MKIVGGYKIVYEYANYLADQGNSVSIFFNSDRGRNSKGLPKILVYLLRYLICKREPKWFNLSPKVRKINVYSLRKKHLRIMIQLLPRQLKLPFLLILCLIRKKFILFKTLRKIGS